MLKAARRLRPMGTKVGRNCQTFGLKRKENDQPVKKSSLKDIVFIMDFIFVLTWPGI
jgi:hypothetical protein